MTETFDRIIEQKKDAITKVMEGLQELCGQPVIQPPDEELRKCSSPEIVYLISLKAQEEILHEHASALVTALYNRNSRVQSVKETLKALDKLDAIRGGASIGW